MILSHEWLVQEVSKYEKIYLFSDRIDKGAYSKSSLQLMMTKPMPFCQKQCALSIMVTFS